MNEVGGADERERLQRVGVGEIDWDRDLREQRIGDELFGRLVAAGKADVQRGVVGKDPAVGIAEHLGELRRELGARFGETGNCLHMLLEFLNKLFVLLVPPRST